jgi:hypothetical protein
LVGKRFKASVWAIPAPQKKKKKKERKERKSTGFRAIYREVYTIGKRVKKKKKKTEVKGSMSFVCHGL